MSGLFFHIVSVRWNGTTITGPVLIYHDEIPLAVGTSNSLICRSSANTGVAWHLMDGTTVRAVGVFNQAISSSGMTSQLQHSRDNDESTAGHNGLWSCRLNGNAESAIPVGLYQRRREYNIIS